jgi:hypothetical protein
VVRVSFGAASDDVPLLRRTAVYEARAACYRAIRVVAESCRALGGKGSQVQIRVVVACVPWGWDAEGEVGARAGE